jgi:heat-inducible transcriptional repressor
MMTCDVLDDRAARVLRHVVEDYIDTAEPVGSRTISKKMGNAYSPATIRNIMADLEEAGYLAQPHTSAGRVPTGVGFRYYVDYLLARRQLARSERDRLARMAAGEGGAPADEVVRQIGRLVSNLSRQACLVLIPRQIHQPLQSIGLVRVSPERILLVALMQGGLVQHRMIEGERDLRGEDIQKITNYLNELAVGHTLPQLRAKVLREMRKEKAHYDRLIRKALLLGARALSEGAHGDVFVEGRANILEQPEFLEDVQMLKRILQAFEEKSMIVRLLDRALESDALQVSIGPENEVEEFRDVSVVACGYRQGEQAMGGIGIVGPVRMDYSRLIPLVEHTAWLLNSVFAHK